MEKCNTGGYQTVRRLCHEIYILYAYNFYRENKINKCFIGCGNLSQINNHFINKYFKYIVWSPFAVAV